MFHSMNEVMVSPHMMTFCRAVNTDRGVGGSVGFRLRGSVRGVGLIREKKGPIFLLEQLFRASSLPNYKLVEIETIPLDVITNHNKIL